MKGPINILLLLMILLFATCRVPLDIEGRSFNYKSKRRVLSINFFNDSICKIKNRFNCKDIDSNLRELTFTCLYKRNADTIYLRNVNCLDNNCQYEPFVKRTYYSSKRCAFLNTPKNDGSFRIGPNYLSEYEKYGMIPNIDIDTLYIKNNTIALFKQGEGLTIGFFFRRPLIDKVLTKK